MREIALDTETTGLSTREGDRITEIGCVEIIDKQVTGNSFHAYVNPERELSAASTKISGLTYDFLKKFDNFEKVSTGFLDFIGNDRLVIHNAKFDMKFLNYELELLDRPHLTNEIVDTLEVAKRKYPGAPISLDALCRRFAIDLSKRTKHGALVDAELLAEVYVLMSVVLTQKNILDSNSAEAELSIQYMSDVLLDRKFDIPESDIENHINFVKNKITNALWAKFVN